MNKESDFQNLWTAGLVWAGPLGFLAWLAWACADDWNHDPNYGHGWFILPLFFFFLWRRWEESAPVEKPNLRLPLSVLFGVPLLVLLLELVRLTPFHWRPILWLIYGTGAALTLVLAYDSYGKPGLKVLGFPLLFLALAIPWPTFIEIGVIREFSFIIAAIVGEILLLSGIFNEVSGRIIHVAQGSIGVDEACSGIRSLQSALMIALAVGEWFRMKSGMRLGLLAAGIGGAFGLNLLRALVLSLLVTQGGNEAMSRWHDTVGLVVLVLLVGWLAGLGWWFRPRNLQEDEGRTTGGLPLVTSSLRRGFIYISLLSYLAFGVAHGWFILGNQTAGQESPFLAESSWPEDVRIEPVPELIDDILRADAGGYLIRRAGEGGEFLGYHFFWKPDRSNGKVLFHRPDICMPGAGWQQVGEAVLHEGTLNGRPAIVHAFRFQSGITRTSLLWLCWADDQPLQFSGQPFSNLQLAFVPDFIRLGKRVFSIEILGLVVPGEVAGPSFRLQERDLISILDKCGDFQFVPKQ